MAKLKTKREGIEASSVRGRATRDRIFRVATAEFAAKGYDGARIDVIAEKAGINKQRIYAYFGDKDGLFTEVWKHTLDLLYEEDSQFGDLGEQDVPNLGRIILKSYMDFHDSHPEFWRIFVIENLVGGRHGRPSRRRKGQPYGHLRELYAMGQKKEFYDKNVSFEAFIFVLTGISSFYTSNKKTMTDTLGINLLDSSVKERLIEEMDRMLFGK